MNTSVLRARIATAIGLAALFPLVNAPAETGGSGGGTGDTGHSVGVHCVAPAEATTTGADPACPAGDTVVGTSTSDDCSVSAVLGEATYDAETGECCYSVEIACEGIKDMNCGCYGRPFVVDGCVRTAGSMKRTGWLGDAVRPARVPAEQRPALVRFWLDNAEAEHSSIAGFAKLVLDLIAVGAPASLVARAQTGGAEELAHARACYALASAYAGFGLGPRPLVSPPVTLAADLVELAVATAREGCVGETIAAQLAAAIAERATDPAVRAVMSAIAEEEARHAELAWETLAWAIGAGGQEVLDAVAPVLAEGWRPNAPTGAEDHPILRAHGLLPDDEQAAICRRAYDEVVAPLALALQARAAA